VIDLQIVLAAIFWIALLLIFQSYVGIYLILFVTTGLKPRSRPLSHEGIPPTLTVIVPAYNEEAIIADKVENLLSLDYPTGRLEIVVASDCSTDGTAGIVKHYADRGVRLVEFTERHGKLGIIDALVPQVSGDVVVITDTNVIFAPDALLRMAEPYCDPEVGAVCGNLRLISPPGGRNVEGEVIFNRYENIMKRLMGRIGMVVSAFGGFQSLRRGLFRPLGSRPVHDDVILPLEVMAQGYKVAYAKDAGAVEATQSTIKAEYLRRIRMTALNLNCIPRALKLAFKAGPKVLFIAASYKVLRWICPYLFVLLLAASLGLMGVSPVYNVAAALFGVTILLAAIGWLRDRYGLKGTIVTDVYHFTAMNIAALAGIPPWLRGAKRYWSPRGM